MIDHDRLFKELLSTFFVDFLQLFLPEVITYLEPASLTFLDKEVFTDVTAGERYETDLLVQAQFQGEPSIFLIHVENQATAQANFGKRMFRYFARLYEKYDYPIYPVVVFSYDQPRTPAPRAFTVDFPDLAVLAFNYQVIQLNQLNWRDFLRQPNPVAAALMAKMQIDPADRPRVKAECLRLLVTLRLDPARMQLISGFVDTYLTLTPDEETTFNLEIDRIEPEAQEQVMEIVTSWMERGIAQGLEQGLEQGRREGELKLVLRWLIQRLGTLDPTLQAQVKGLTEPQIEQLSDLLPTLTCSEDLARWLDDLEAAEGFVGLHAQVLHQLRQQVGEITPLQKQQLLNLSEDQLQQHCNAEHWNEVQELLKQSNPDRGQPLFEGGDSSSD
jgi:predicted transposase YdaD